MNLIPKILLAASIALLSVTAFAAVDVNKASQAELESIKGIGTAASTRILDERKKAPFKDWGDLVDRVRGIGPGNAAKFSTDGLTVNGSAFTALAGKPEATKARSGAMKAKGDTAAKDAKPPATAATKG